MPDNMTSSPLVAALDPRVDEHVVQEQMLDAAGIAAAGAVDPLDQGGKMPQS
ncbi:hypothetical protein D9M69_687210 [compost metagenome]